jgi:hypothetical protein
MNVSKFRITNIHGNKKPFKAVSCRMIRRDIEEGEEVFEIGMAQDGILYQSITYFQNFVVPFKDGDEIKTKIAGKLKEKSTESE